MNECLSSYEIKRTQFLEVVGVCGADVNDVKAVRRRLGYVKGRFLRDLLRSMRKWRKERTQPKAVEIYTDLLHVCQALSNMLEERRIIG